VDGRVRLLWRHRYLRIEIGGEQLVVEELRLAEVAAINVSYGGDGHANTTWTDMREFRPLDNGYAQSIFFARK
jgi:hypothetical protein